MAIKKNAAAVALAKKRSASLTPERRREIAQNAVNTRWENARSKANAAPKARRSAV